MLLYIFYCFTLHFTSNHVGVYLYFYFLLSLSFIYLVLFFVVSLIHALHFYSSVTWVFTLAFKSSIFAIFCLLFTVFFYLSFLCYFTQFNLEVIYLYCLWRSGTSVIFQSFLKILLFLSPSGIFHWLLSFSGNCHFYVFIHFYSAHCSIVHFKIYFVFY